jgi:hypothetical protein
MGSLPRCNRSPSIFAPRLENASPVARLTYCPSPTRGPPARRPATPTSADPLPSLAPPHVPGPPSPLLSAPPLMTRARRSPQRRPPRLINLRRRPTRSSLRTPVVTGKRQRPFSAQSVRTSIDRRSSFAPRAPCRNLGRRAGGHVREMIPTSNFSRRCVVEAS